MEELVVHNQKEFDELAKVIIWNKWLMSTLGLWPHGPNHFIFFINFGYFVYHMLMEYLDLFLFIDNLEHVIENLTENMAFTQILVRIAMLKKYNHLLGEVISEVLKDYNIRVYRTPDECKVFINYMKKAKLFVKLLCIFVAMTASSYYAKPITSRPPEVTEKMGEENFTMPFILPYRFHLFYEVNDFRTYVWTYASHFPFVFVSGFGQIAADCLMVTLVFHVSGKLSTLALRIATIKPDLQSCKKELDEIIIEHARLLKMGKSIEEAFSETLLVHLVGATSLVCSHKVCEAYYDCLWYQMPQEMSRNVVLCMARSQKPLGLSAGKFGAFCLSTLTDVVKTAMGYLSVLRSFLTIEYQEE